MKPIKPEFEGICNHISNGMHVFHKCSDLFNAFNLEYTWIEKVLSNRCQRVLINGKHSTWEKVTNGVPQGRVLGPVLFLIFINDLPDAMDCALKLFADDTKLYSAIATHSDEEKLQGNIFSACDWANKWQMTFNVNKYT